MGVAAAEFKGLADLQDSSNWPVVGAFPEPVGEVDIDAASSRNSRHGN